MTPQGKKTQLYFFKKVACKCYGIGSLSMLLHERLTTEIPTELNKNEQLRWIAEHSLNIYELAEAYRELNYKLSQEAYTIEGIISENINRIRAEDFERFGDKNQITKTMRRKWFADNALPIDVAVQEMNAVFHTEITIQNVVEFIIRFPRNDFERWEKILMDEIADKFYEITTYKLKDYLIDELCNLRTAKIPEVDVSFVNLVGKIDQEAQELIQFLRQELMLAQEKLQLLEAEECPF